MKKWIVAVAAVASSLTVLTACGGQEEAPSGSIVDFSKVDESSIQYVQLQKPENGQQMAVINLTFHDQSTGTIKAVLYPDYTPKTVQNFINRVNEGYYNNSSVFSIQQDLFFLAGSNEAGHAWKTDDGEPIPNEYSQDLWPFTGALCAVGDNADTSDSRFMIINDYQVPESLEQEAESVGFPKSVMEKFKEIGGVPTVWGQYTIFGQVIEGIDVIEKVMEVPYDFTNYKPIEAVTITDITMTTYQEP